MRTFVRTKGDFDAVLRQWLPYFFAVVFAATVLGAFQGYHFHNAFRIGDWLINYQGGMVRRGIIGEFFYQLSLVTPINPGIYAVMAQTVFYGIFFYFSYRLINGQKSLVPLFILIFIPLTFTFQLNDMQGGYRKEIIYFALLAYTAWSAYADELKRFQRVFTSALLVYPLLILTHEMLALFLPYLLCVYLIRVGINRGALLKLALLLMPSAAAFFAAIHYAGTPEYAAAIMKSLSQQGYAVKGGAIAYIGQDLSFALEKVRAESSFQNVLALLPTLLLSLLAFRPVSQNVVSLFKDPTTRLLLGSSLAATLLLGFVAVDWGRFIYIHLVSLLVLILINKRTPVELQATDKDNPVVANRWLVAGFIVYFTLWHVGHTTDTFSLFEVINPVNTLFVIAFFLRYKLISAASYRADGQQKSPR